MGDQTVLDQLTLRATLHPVFDFHRLQEDASRGICGEFGAPVESRSRVVLTIELAGDFLCVASLAADGREQVRVFLQSGPLEARVLARCTGAGLADALALAILRGNDTDPEHARIAARLSDAIHAAALGALEWKHSTALHSFTRLAREGALLECSFETRESRKRALTGDFSEATDLALGGAPLDPHIELHLPFIRHAACSDRFDVLAGARAEADVDGRILVFEGNPNEESREKNCYQSTLALFGPSADAQCRFTLTHTDRRTLASDHEFSSLGNALRACGLGPAATEWIRTAREPGSTGQLEASLALSLPGKLAAAWLEGPDEESDEFFPIYSAVSVALQRALRGWLPYLYFSGAVRYSNTSEIFPLIAYQSTLVSKGRPRFEFTHDLVDAQSELLTRVSLMRGVRNQLASIRESRLAAGDSAIAQAYAPDRASRIVETLGNQPRMLNALLVGEGEVVDWFVRLGLAGRAFVGGFTNSPRKASQRLSRLLDEFNTGFGRKLRRFYAGQDCSTLGSLLLVVATRALNAAMGRPAPLSATVRLSAGPVERTFHTTV